MKTILLLLSLLFFLSCSVKDTVNPKGTFAITVDDKKYTPNISFFGNENCDWLFINVSNSLKKDFPYKLEMKLSKKGDIVSANLLSLYNNYESSLFNPKDFIAINEFDYNTETNRVSFSFDGKLFQSAEKPAITIKGDFDNVELTSVACSESYFSGLEADVSSDFGNTNRFYSTISSGTVGGTVYNWFFYSNDGYRILFENKAGIAQLNPGTYSINSESSSPVRIEFRRFIGQPDRVNNLLVLDKDWKTYKLTGTLEVERQETTAYKGTNTFGKLSFTAYDDTNKPVYVLKNGQFSVSSIR